MNNSGIQVLEDKYIIDFDSALQMALLAVRAECKYSFGTRHNIVLQNNELESDILSIKDAKIFSTNENDKCMFLSNLLIFRVLAKSNARFAAITLGKILDKHDKNIFGIKDKNDFLTNQMKLDIKNKYLDPNTTNLHAWITLENNFIVDLSIEYSNNKIIFGMAGALNYTYEPYYVVDFYDSENNSHVVTAMEYFSRVTSQDVCKLFIQQIGSLSKQGKILTSY